MIESITEIDLSIHGSPSLVMRDLSELLTLPFVAGFDIQIPTSDVMSPPKETRTTKRVTYVGLTKKTMPLLLDIFLRFMDKLDIYTDETLETICSVCIPLPHDRLYIDNVMQAYAVPIKLKYECPPPSNFGNDIPLWKTATSSFLRIVKESTRQLKLFGNGERNRSAEIKKNSC